jgi:hypothetical protein
VRWEAECSCIAAEAIGRAAVSNATVGTSVVGCSSTGSVWAWNKGSNVRSLRARISLTSHNEHGEGKNAYCQVVDKVTHFVLFFKRVNISKVTRK